MASSSFKRFLLDTNILIHYARADALARWIEAQYSLNRSPTSPIISIVTVGEVRAFTRHRNWGAKKMREIQKVMDECVVVPLDLAGIVDAYAELNVHNISVGRTMGDNDL